MSITDIIIDRNSTPSSGTLPVPLSEKGIESIITTSKGALYDDPQSGSIIKVLLDNGFQEKIETGYQKGHTFTVLHIPPNPDFTLIESWNEMTINDQGVSVSQPRKTYQFFRIIQETVPVMKKEESHQEVIERPFEILPKQEPVKTPEITLPQETTVEVPTTSPQEIQPISPDQKEEKNIPPLTKEEPITISPKQQATPSNDATPQKPLSSYELLKQKFQAGASTVATTPTIPANEITLSPSTPKEDFLHGVFGTSLDEWEQAKNIPARAFIYPTEYTWGYDASGNPRFHHLEEYPTHARYLRQKIATSLEELKVRGVDIETITLDRALDALVTYQLLHD